MKWKHWAVLIILVLLNYIIFSTALTQLAEQRRPKPQGTRTPQPTFASTEANPVAWKILPTSTTRPPWLPSTPTPTPTDRPVVASPTAAEAPAIETPEATSQEATARPSPTAQATQPPPTAPPTATPTGEVATVTHTVKRGETLSEIAKAYEVTTQAIVAANDLENANLIVTGQKLIIPAPGQVPTQGPTATPKPKTPTPESQATPTATPTGQAAPPTGSEQFTGAIVWDPMVAPNCAGPAISRQSVIQDGEGNPVNGAVVEVECYGNLWLSHPSGTEGEYEPGHYDFSFGQSQPQEWTCSVRVVEVDGTPVDSSQVLLVHFDTNSCRPGGEGHQVAIVNWTKHW
ncbi:MAG: LysM peptidoglycan-binding domain-containing protein [Anaerolineae bacterium]|jgi:LysM repeat protein